MYRPHKGKVERFIKHLYKVHDVKKENWFLGDFNVNFKVPKARNTRKVKNMCRDLNMEWLIKKITRPNTLGVGGTTIDNILTDSKYIAMHGVLPDLLSDHLPIYAIRKKKRNFFEKIKITNRVYKKYDKEAFQQYMRDQDWSKVYKASDINEKLRIVQDTARRFLNQHCPIRTYTVKDYKTQWMDPDTLKLINTRNLHMRRFKKYKNTPDLKYAKLLRVKITSKVRKAQGAYVIDKLNKYKKDAKRFWKEMNKLIKPPKKSVIIKLKNQRTKEDIKDIPNYINNFYGEIGEKLFIAKNLQVKGYDKPDEEYEGANTVPENFTKGEVLLALKELDTKKPSGIKDMNSGVVYDMMESCLHLFTHIFNYSFKTGRNVT